MDVIEGIVHQNTPARPSVARRFPAPLADTPLPVDGIAQLVVGTDSEE